MKNILDQLTVTEALEIAKIVSGINQPQATISQGAQTLNRMIGKKVIIRTYSAGVWFGTLDQKSGNEVIITKARRMWKWWAKESISLSAVALYGIKHEESKICPPVDQVWLEAIEIIPCSDDAIESIEGAENVQSQ